MKFSIEGEIRDIQPGIEELSAAFGFSFFDKGIPVTVQQWDKENIHVSLDKHKGNICYHEKIHFYRALSLFLEHAQRSGSFQIEENPQFEMNGIMLDCSRNAVMKEKQVKKLIRNMAMMGLNMLMLYIEDTYEVEEQPYFGYMRGRYSKKELRQIDDYANQFGIKVIPSIQTLAHLSTFLRWDVNTNIKDTDDILLAESSETYQLIDQMIEASTAPFRTNLIHIGMDEAHLLGKGQYLNKNGYKPSFDIMSGHLKEVLKITSQKGLSPMIWSDMYFRMASRKGDYYDTKAVIPERVINELPDEVQFVYWDYYHEDEAFYKQFLQKHKALGSTPLFAGGIWTWNGIAPNYQKTFHTMNAAMSACKKGGISEVFATLWGDDGAETDPFTSLLGMQLIAEHSYMRDIDMEKVRNRFEFITGVDMNDFLLLGEIDHPPGSDQSMQLEPDNPSKFLLWQDPLLGLFDKHLEGVPLNQFYEQLTHKLEKGKKRAGGWSSTFNVPCQICSVLSIKSELGVILKALYDSGDKEGLRHLAAHNLPELKRRVERLRELHYQLWMDNNKPFGWEVLDIRYGGLSARIDTTSNRLTEYLEGRLDSISELEEERLPFSDKKEGYVRSNVYKQIVSANAF